MVQQSMRLKLLILPLSLVVAVVAVIFFIKPSFSEMMDARSSLQEKQGQLNNLKSQDQKLQSLKSKWESLGEEKTLVATALPETEDVDFYISELVSKASRSGVLLSDIKAGDQQGTTADIPPYFCSASLAAAALSPNANAQAAAPEATQLTDSCLSTMNITLQAKGSWEQLLDFFKYLEDMNRISNAGTVAVSADTQLQGQAPSDVLTANLSVYVFFKDKIKGGNMALAGALAGQGNFNQNAIDKLKGVIYTPYSTPAVSPGGERNIFK